MAGGSSKTSRPRRRSASSCSLRATIPQVRGCRGSPRYGYGSLGCPHKRHRSGQLWRIRRPVEATSRDGRARSARTDRCSGKVVNPGVVLSGPLVSSSRDAGSDSGSSSVSCHSWSSPGGSRAPESGGSTSNSSGKAVTTSSTGSPRTRRYFLPSPSTTTSSTSGRCSASLIRRGQPSPSACRQGALGLEAASVIWGAVIIECLVASVWIIGVRVLARLRCDPRFAGGDRGCAAGNRDTRVDASARGCLALAEQALGGRKRACLRHSAEALPLAAGRLAGGDSALRRGNRRGRPCCCDHAGVVGRSRLRGSP